MMQSPSDFSITWTLPLSTDLALRRRYLLTDDDIRANFRFGLLLETLDLLAGETAISFVRTIDPDARVVTAAVDGIQIRSTAEIDRDIVMHARINHVFTSSLEVGIRIEQMNEGVATHVASCYFTMAARKGSNSLSLSPLTHADELERRRSAQAIARREAYLHGRSVAERQPLSEEYALLSALHAAQDHGDFNGLLAAKMTTSGWEETYPEHENVPQKIFGGHVIHRAFVYATICAELVAPDRPVIVSVNRINFHHPVRIGDRLQFESRVVYTGWSSIVVEVDITRRSRDRTTTALCNTCIFTFSNVNEELRPQEVPEVYPSKYAEDARYLSAYRRHLEYRALAERAS
jgi:acyl-coenzyme A thioesterase 9